MYCMSVYRTDQGALHTSGDSRLETRRKPDLRGCGSLAAHAHWCKYWKWWFGLRAKARSARE
eukprot:906641-Pleurochrysis_carterae.AAC.2